MVFAKYEFTQAQWDKIKTKIQATSTDLEGNGTTYFTENVVELGQLVLTPAVIEDMQVIEEAILSDKYSVDILWKEEPLTDFNQYEIYPDPCGVHTFAGLEGLYAERYYTKYPEKRPLNDIGERAPQQ
jgi:hypothetical protein